MIITQFKDRALKALKVLKPLFIIIIILNILGHTFLKKITDINLLGTDNLNKGFTYLVILSICFTFFLSIDFFKNKVQTFNKFCDKKYSYLLLGIFILSFIIKSFYLNFHFNSDYLSYESIFKNVFHHGNWLYEMDDSPLYTLVCYTLFKINGSISYPLIVIFQVLLGCVTIVISTDLLRIVSNSKTLAIAGGLILAAYFEPTMWEAVIRYDTFSTFCHVLGLYALVRFFNTPSNRNLIFVIFSLALSLIGKETIIYMFPFYLFFLFVGFLFSKHIRLSQILIIAFATLAITLPPIVYKNSIYKEKFSVASNKKPVVLLWNVHLFNILDKSNNTKFPEIRDELISFYENVFTDEEKNKDIIHKTIFQMNKYHESTNEKYFTTDSNNRYTELARIEPFLNETIFFNIPQYTYNSVIRYLYNVNSILPALPKPSFQIYEVQLYKNKFFLWLNHYFLPNYSRGFWIFSCFLIYLIIRSKKYSTKSKSLLIAYCFYPIIFGLFMAAATVSEYHRLLLPVHYLMIPMSLLLISELNQTEVS